LPRVVGWAGLAIVGGFFLTMVASSDWGMAPIVGFIAAEYLFVGWLVRRAATAEITLGSEGIHFHNHARTVHIPYRDIRAIEAETFPYLGGWLIVRGPDETVRVTVTLEGIAEFVQRLKRHVDLQNSQAVYDRRELFRFFTTSIYCGQSWARMTGLGSGATLVWLAVVFAPILALEFMGAAAAIPIVAGVLAWLGAEAVFARHVARGADEVHFLAPERDHELERRTYFHAAIGWLVMVVAAVALLLL
jgi:hypothetical protein